MLHLNQWGGDHVQGCCIKKVAVFFTLLRLRFRFQFTEFLFGAFVNVGIGMRDKMSHLLAGRKCPQFG